MKIIKILGGLGNQMFQYALYLALKEKYPNEILKIDTSCFRGYPLHNGYELKRIFGIDSEEATFWDKLKIAYPYSHYRSWQIFKRVLPKRETMIVEKNNEEFENRVFTKGKSCYYDGYWQNERYFKDIRDTILKVFEPKVINPQSAELAKKILAKESVSIHVRKGDYVNNPIFKNICDIAYYQKAIGYIQNKINCNYYCIFSNDIEWCKSNLSHLIPKDKVTYIDWNTGKDSYQDMYLMSCCKHNIIANSSFSWWGAWLNNNKGKIVLCPQKWNNKQDSLFELPNNWIRIK